MIKTPNLKFLTPVLWIFFSLLLSACGSLLDTGQDTVADNIFDLEAISGSGAGDEKTALLIDPPTYPAYVGTFKIAVKPGGREINYLSGARWSDQAPALIVRFLMVSLENTGPFLVNTSQGAALPKDYKLVIDIRDFSAHIDAGGQPRAVVELDVSLVHAGQMEVVATSNFVADVSADENSKAAIAAAFQNAMEEIARDMNTWLQGEI